MSTESINAVKSKIKNLREWVTPVRTTSAFLSKGVLTPEEFVKAGTIDYLLLFIFSVGCSNSIYYVYYIKNYSLFFHFLFI
jgi:hypothetical protein